MASILEFTIADEAAAAIDNVGSCSHSCCNHSPLGLAKPEADDLQRFDPDAFQKIKLGVSVHDVEIEDFDCIGELAHLQVVNQFDHRNDKKLHKHAIAIRLNRSILIASNCPEKDTIESVCQAFNNNYLII